MCSLPIEWHHTQVELELDLGAGPLSDDDLFGSSSSGGSGLGSPHARDDAAKPAPDPSCEAASRAQRADKGKSQGGLQAGSKRKDPILLPRLAPQLAASQGQGQQQPAGDDEDVVWEDVGAGSNGAAGDHRSSEDHHGAQEEGGGGRGPQPQHWRERMAARQKFWSTSHGFRMGRKLGDWGEGAEPAVAGVAGTVVSGGGAMGARAGSEGLDTMEIEGGKDGAEEEEDPELQEAIRQSLAAAGTDTGAVQGSIPGPTAAASRRHDGTAHGPQQQPEHADSHSDAEVVWEGVDEGHEAGGLWDEDQAASTSLSDMPGHAALHAALQQKGQRSKPAAATAAGTAGPKSSAHVLIQSINAHSKARLEAPAGSKPIASLPPIPPPRPAAHKNVPAPVQSASKPASAAGDSSTAAPALPTPAPATQTTQAPAAALSFDFFSDAQPLTRKRTSPAPAVAAQAKRPLIQPLLLQPKGQRHTDSPPPEPGSTEAAGTQPHDVGGEPVASSVGDVRQAQPAAVAVDALESGTAAVAAVAGETGHDVEWEDLDALVAPQQVPAAAPHHKPAPTPHPAPDAAAAAAAAVPAPVLPSPALIHPAPSAPTALPHSTPVKPAAASSFPAAGTTPAPGTAPSKVSTQLSPKELAELLDEGEDEEWVEWVPPSRTTPAQPAAQQGAADDGEAQGGAAVARSLEAAMGFASQQVGCTALPAPAQSQHLAAAQQQQQQQGPPAPGKGPAFEQLLSELDEFEAEIAAQEEAEEAMALEAVNEPQPPQTQQPSAQTPLTGSQQLSASQQVAPTQQLQSNQAAAQPPAARQAGVADDDMWWAEEGADDEEEWVSWSPAMKQGTGAKAAGAQPATGATWQAPQEPPPQDQPAQLPPPQPVIDIDAALEAAEAEGEVLRREQRRAAVGAEGPSPEMYAECQELLQMFGLPFIVAPVEVGTELQGTCSC